MKKVMITDWNDESLIPHYISDDIEEYILGAFTRNECNFLVFPFIDENTLEKIGNYIIDISSIKHIAILWKT